MNKGYSNSLSKRRFGSHHSSVDDWLLLSLLEVLLDVLLEVLLDVLLEVLSLLLAGTLADEERRLSVMYQPLPLNTIPGVWSKRRTLPLHSGQRVSGLSENDCRLSNCKPHVSQRYA